MYKELACSRAHFNDVLQTLVATEFVHSHLEVAINRGARDYNPVNSRAGIVSGVTDTAIIR